MTLCCNLMDSFSLLNLLDNFASAVQFMVDLHLAHYVQMNGCYER